MSDAVSRQAFLARGARLAVAAAAFPAFVPFGSAEAAVDPRVRSLARLTKGRVLARSAAGYNQARLPYDTSFDDIFPLAVLEASGWRRGSSARQATTSGASRSSPRTAAC